MGQAYLREWPTLKPLLDAAYHAVLGHGFEPVKAERVQQLYEVVVKLTHNRIKIPDVRFIADEIRICHLG